MKNLSFLPTLLLLGAASLGIAPSATASRVATVDTVATADTAQVLVLLVDGGAPSCTCVASLLTPDESTFYEDLRDPNDPNGSLITTLQVSIVWNNEDPVDGKCKVKNLCPGPEVPCKIKFSFTLQVAPTFRDGASVSGPGAPSGATVAGASSDWNRTIESACEKQLAPGGTSNREEYTVTATGFSSPLFVFNPGVDCGNCGAESEGSGR